MSLKQRIEKPGQKKLLSIDGGGIRGVLALSVLQKIEDILKAKSGRDDFVLADYFDYIAGTSTGGIIAAGLSIGMPVKDITDFYIQNGAQMFEKASLLKRLRYEYNSEPLAQKLREVFGADTTFGSDKLKTLLLEDTVADMPHLIAELNRLRDALGPETVAMMQRHEAEGTLDHPEYQAAITILNYRHVCRLAEWPAPLKRSLDDWNMGPYMTMQGPNEFFYIGNLKDWNRVPELHRITAPILITCGQHDELTPACAARMRQHLPNAELKVFPNSSHMPFYEEPQAYYPALLDFLGRHRG